MDPTNRSHPMAHMACSDSCMDSRIHMRHVTRSYVWHDEVVSVTYLIWMCAMTPSCCTCQFPLKMPGLRNPRTPERQIPRHKFKFLCTNCSHNLNFNLYRERTRNLRFMICWILVGESFFFGGIYHTCMFLIVLWKGATFDWFTSAQIQSQNLNLNLYREKTKNLSFSIYWILGMYLFQWNLSYVHVLGCPVKRARVVTDS